MFARSRRPGLAGLAALALAAGIAAGCKTGAAGLDGGPGSPDAPPTCDPALEQCAPIPDEADPCTEPDYWPLTLASERYPLWVHYSRRAQRPVVEELLVHLERGWEVGVDELGFSPPPPDEGLCGPDERFDVFVWEGLIEGYVASIAEIEATPHDDRVVYLALDPWGPYGGPLLGVTAVHELNHAMQAADDWWEPSPIFEMTAVFFEELVYPEVDDYFVAAADFQANPDWSLDRDDGYETWYMYGAALYLHMLRDRYFDGDARFAADMWRGARSPPEVNEPDFVDALEALLAPQQVSFADTVVELARWRWFTGERDDGAHFRDGAGLPPVALAADVSVAAASLPIAPAPMLFGNAYVRVRRERGQPQRVEVKLVSDAEVSWVLQAVPGPGGSDGEILPVVDGRAILDLGELAERALIATAVPLGPYDPDERDDQRYPLTLELIPVR